MSIFTHSTPRRSPFQFLYSQIRAIATLYSNNPECFFIPPEAFQLSIFQELKYQSLHALPVYKS
ncbi:MAG: hypothetical protein ICV78_19480 [Tolypothrix sp. Co-bin9]|nr:hypothetical protein [Tolypothrix sp. Co-bin9]